MTATDTPIAEGEKDSVENLSMDDLIAQRVGMYNGEPEVEAEPEAEVEAEVEGEPEAEVEVEAEGEVESEVEGEPEAEEEAEPEVEAEGELDIEAVMSLEPEQIQELANKGKTRLLSRVGELIAKNKAYESEIAELKTQQPVAAPVSDLPEPISKLTSQDEVTKAMEGYERTMEIADKVLGEHTDYDAEDIVYEAEGQKYTKKQIEQAQRGAIQALSKHLPKQLKRLEDVAKFKDLRGQWQEQAKKEIPEIQDEESDIGKAYSEIVSHPNMQRLANEMPELATEIDYLIAHAVNSIHSKRKPKVPTKAGKKLTVKPPASPVGSGSARPATHVKGKAANLVKRFESSGSVEDLVAARIARASA